MTGKLLYDHAELLVVAIGASRWRITFVKLRESSLFALQTRYSLYRLTALRPISIRKR